MLFKGLYFLFVTIIFMKQVMAAKDDIKEYGILILPEERCSNIAEKLNSKYRTIFA